MEFEQAIESVTGMPVEEIRDTPVDDLRKKAEDKLGKPVEVKGVVRGVRVLAHGEVEKILDRALK